MNRFKLNYDTKIVNRILWLCNKLLFYHSRKHLNVMCSTCGVVEYVLRICSAILLLLWFADD